MNGSPRGYHRNVIRNLLVESIIFTKFLTCFNTISVLPESVSKSLNLKKRNRKRFAIERTKLLLKKR